MISFTLHIGHDAFDTKANDADVDLSDRIIEALEAKFGKLEIIERDSDELIVTGSIET